MAQAILNQILAQIETLDLEELQQLNQAIQRYLADKQETPQRATFHKALLTSGLVKQLKQPSYTQQSERQLIQVQDKPVSETIIEESR
jgi:glycine/D-amino acid oxidase-like deaminating enzyme